MDLPELKIPKTVEQGVEYSLATIEIEERRDPSRLKYLRVSSFPFCGTQWLLNFPKAATGKRSASFTGSFFTSVGTTVHNSIQSIMDMSPWLIQDWKCFACGTLHQFCTKPKRCKKCKNEALQGREHEYKDDILVGHLDGAMQLTNDAIDILDYKTTSVRKFEEPGYLPDVGNVRQIEAYAALKREQGFNVTGWTLIYILRNSAQRRYCTSTKFYGHSFEEEYPRILKRIARYKKDFVCASTAQELSDVEDMVSRRRLRPDKEDTNDLCQYCQYKSLCVDNKKLTPRIENSIKVLVHRGMPK